MKGGVKLFTGMFEKTDRLVYIKRLYFEWMKEKTDRKIILLYKGEHPVKFK